MTIKQIFPTILICLDVAAAIVHLCFCDIRHFIYWISAAVLTATVTY